MPLTRAPKYGSYLYPYSDPEMWDLRFSGSSPSGKPLRGDIGRSIPGNLQPLQITLRGVLGDGTSLTTDDLLRDQRDAFLWAHKPGVLRKLYLDSDRYWRNAQVVSVGMPEVTGLLHLPFSITFEMADPFQYAASASTDTWATPSSGDTRVIANDGDAVTWPEISVFPSSSATLAFQLFNDTLLPAAPTLAASGTGGYLAAATHWVKLTWLYREGESAAGAAASQATTGTTSKLTITPPTAPEDALGYYVYVGVGAGEPADSAKFLQHTFGPIAVDKSFVLRTLATSGDAASVPTFGSLKLDGAVVSSDALIADCLEQNVRLNEASKMSYLSSPFLPFVAGNNSLRVVFSGATLGSIGFEWRKRWL